MAKADAYSQKEENTFRQDLFRRMDTQDTNLSKILDQTTKTNGRVTVLETKTEDYTKIKDIVASLSGWKLWISGAVAVVLLAGGIFINLFLKDIYRTSQDNAQKLIDAQRDQIVKDIVSQINTDYNLNIK